ncbi:DeoR/GlpR transcriptional regulator [Leucobacter sp. wl10]|nr:DeoR/GlpR family DNA-binding transcription regulator [Leucobacter sp. wl10]RGE22580.1 DeoR/GlpR transcriptional regulator [Leucobacter sp. wl10]
MYAAERQQLILDTARSDGRVDVSAQADALGVTTETIRRDLTALERRGLLRRVHGGAIPVDRLEPETGVEVRIGLRAEAKRRIAQRVLEEIPANATLLLDAGTTTLAIARALPANASLTVITNSLIIGAELAARPGISLLQLGGRVRPITGAAVGPWPNDSLAGLTVDIGVFGANGFDVAHGLTTPDHDEAATKRAMLRASRTTVLASDASKAARAHLYRFAEIEEIDMVVTDTDIDAELAEQIRRAGPTVVIA